VAKYRQEQVKEQVAIEIKPFPSKPRLSNTRVLLIGLEYRYGVKRGKGQPPSFITKKKYVI
jgi:hypothetical protein